MFGIGTGEILLILVIAMLVVGPEKMVDFAGKAGRLLARLRLQTDEITRDFREALAVDEITQEIQRTVEDVKGDGQPALHGAEGTPRDAGSMPGAANAPAQPRDEGASAQDKPAVVAPPARVPDLSEKAAAVSIQVGALVPEDEDVEATVLEQATWDGDVTSVDADPSSDTGNPQDAVTKGG